MPTAAALTLLEGIVRDQVAPSVAARTQVAFVRALVDELGRRSPSDPTVTALRGQLDEEASRLEKMLAAQVCDPPASDIRSSVVRQGAETSVHDYRRTASRR